MITISQKQLWNACLGNLFEHYDTALFSFLSPFLAPLIFSEEEPVTALILTYAIIPVAMLARPVGALVFGYIGDIYGRERSLFLTLAGMAFISGCIALTPTYLQVGILAPILFCLGKALQNFFAAGETMGGAILILENASEKHHDLLSGLYGASAIGGHLLASVGVYAITKYSTTNSGWRFLYLCGCMTALFGCMIRLRSSSSQSVRKFSYSIENLKHTVWSNRKMLLVIILSSGFAHATYSIALVLMNGFIPLVSSLTKTEMMKINTYLLILDFCALPFFGWLASQISREKLMLSASLGIFLLAMPLLLLLKGASISVIIGVQITFVIFGVAFFAPFHAWIQQLVPPNCRYIIISLGYAIGSQFLGSPTAAIALWFFKKTGMISSIAWYWMLLAIASSLSIVAAMTSRSTSKRNEQNA
jgi:MHS family proline/betaine transporter-like MFS transporter